MRMALCESNHKQSFLELKEIDPIYSRGNGGERRTGDHNEGDDNNVDHRQHCAAAGNKSPLILK